MNESYISRSPLFNTVITVFALSPYLVAPIVTISLISIRLALALSGMSNIINPVLFVSELSASTSPASATAVILAIDIEGSFHKRLMSALSPTSRARVSALPIYRLFA